MKSGLPELTALSLLATFGCGLAWAHDDRFFAALFWRHHGIDDCCGDTMFAVKPTIGRPIFEMPRRSIAT
jgi:hypothetical protein